MAPPKVAVGARWVRVALQVNPFEYVGANAPSKSFAGEQVYNDALVTEMLELGIEMIAVADHWNARSAEGLINAASAAGIVALPGFEASTGEGVHLLVLFPAGTDLGVLDAAIGACGGTPKSSSGRTGRPFAEIAAEMRQRGALVIAAHANVASGLLGGQSGVPRAEMWCHKDLNAAAISPAQPIGVGDQAIISNVDALCKRNHPLAIIYADDICHPDRLRQAGGTSWVKLSTMSLESLAMALRTPTTRVSVHDPSSIAHPTIKQVGWQGGFLDGVVLPMSESLTALIGGRGTGKSTVIESVRYALGVAPIGQRAAADHQEFITKVLKAATKVSVLVETAAPVRAVYTIERTVPDPAVVRDAAGTVLAQSPRDVLGPVEIFGQHELAELADDKVYVAQLLAWFGGDDPDVARREAVSQELAKNRSDQLLVVGNIAKLESELADLPRLKEQLDLFEAQGVDQSLTDQKVLQREANLYTSAAERISRTTASVEAIDVGSALDVAFVAPVVTKGLPRAANVDEIAPILTQLSTDLAAQRQQMLDTAEVAKAALSASNGRWETATAAIRDQYETVIRTLQDAGLDATRYLALGGRIEKLETAAATRSGMDKELAQLKARRLQLVADHGDLELASRQRLNQAATAANAHVKGLVIVKPVRSSDRSPIEEVVARLVPGQRTQIVAAIRRDDFSPRAFVAAARDGAARLETEYAVKGAQATSLMAAGERLFMELEEQRIGLAAEAQLNIASTGTPMWKGLDSLSKGQKATALLLLLLTDSNTPLVIDQPEDNLDNQFVYSGIVPRVRELKGSRQLIIATHNANLPVLGDAELVVALESHDAHGAIVKGGIGSIDDEIVRGMAGDLLEGGREAFDARRHIYNY